MRKLLVFVVVLVLAVVAFYIGAGFGNPPTVQIASPERYVGVSTPLDVAIDTPGGTLSSLKVEFEQDGTRTPVVSLDGAAAVAGDSAVRADGPDRLRVTATLGRETIKGLKSGSGRIVVTAVRPAGFGLRHLETSTVRDVSVRLERPKIAVLSTHHYINLGGSEMIVYRVSPSDVQSGVRVGDLEYPGYPATGVALPNLPILGPDVRVAFFALRYDQDLNTPMKIYARDEAGNSATADFEHRTFPKPFKNSRISIDDKFLDRVVPAILEGTTEVTAKGSTLESFLAINGDLRKLNAEKIASFASKTAPELLWGGTAFHAFANTAVESAFADRRTYIYQGKDVDHQTHLGFDLASVANAPIVAANRGRVVFADNLGIYGNCVIIDHGMGVQSLYAHLSSIGVQVGAMVEKEAELGRSGMTGLAGGDHLHFTMLVNGQMVNPIEWWDSHWIEDRILRKIRESQ
jgi:murein DD-endopeptidase MepM/ murein hydrolase activator NlpD